MYSGALDTESMSLEEVIEVLAVADQYETTSLRVLCEGVLVSRVEDANVFFLLQVADRFSARQLRVSSKKPCHVHFLRGSRLVLSP